MLSSLPAETTMANLTVRDLVTVVSKGISASSLSRCQCSSLTYLHRDAERCGSAGSLILSVFLLLELPHTTRRQNRQKEREEGLAQAAAQKQRAPPKPQSDLPSQWIGPSCLQNNGREQDSWEEVYTCGWQTLFSFNTTNRSYDFSWSMGIIILFQS